MRARHELSRSLPAHAHQPDVRSVGSGQRRPRRTQGTDRRACGEVSRRLHRLLRRRLPTRSRRSCAIRIRRSSSFQGSGCSALPRTSAKRGSRPSSSSTPFTSWPARTRSRARRPPTRCRRRSCPSRPRTFPASTTTWRCRGSKRSASNTGRSRRPSCSGCRPSGNSAARSRSSSAAAAASAGTWPCSWRSAARTSWSPI